MSTNLERIAEISGIIGTEESERLRSIAYQCTHAHPRRNKTLENIWRKLRKLAKDKGVWDAMKQNQQQYAGGRNV